MEWKILQSSTAQPISSMFLILLGSLDCLTTVVGSLFFGTAELNPILSGLVATNLLAFVLIKLTVTFCVGLIFIMADRTLLCVSNQNSKSLIFARRLLRTAYFVIILFLAIAVTNNLLVLLHFIW